MKDLKDELVRRLAGKRFGVVGIGNIFKGDDGAGCALITDLEGKLDMPIVDCAEVPENYGGWVEKMGLDSVIYVDAVEFGGEPGEARIIPLEKLMQTASSTHSLSLHYMIKFLKEEWNGDPILIGIQPRSLRLGEGLSPPVEAAVRELARILASLP